MRTLQTGRSVGMVLCLLLAITTRSRAGDTAATSGGKATVLILPFAPINPASPDAWLGKSIQQSLTADLTSVAAGRVIASETIAGDDAAAIAAAQKAGVTYVIRGAFATSGGDVRITGRALDVTTGKPVAGIKVTGPTNNLFTLEDQLTAQVRRRLALNPPPPSPAPGSVPAVENVPPMEAMRMPAGTQSPDPYVQAFVAPLNPLTSPDRRQLDYNYYFGQPAPILGTCGYGFGIGGGYYGGCGFGGYGIGGGFGFGGGGFAGRWSNPFGTAAVHTGYLAPFHSATLHGLPLAPAMAGKSR